MILSYSTMYLMTKALFILFLFSSNLLIGQTSYFSVLPTKTNTVSFSQGAKLVKFNLEKACLNNPFISVVDRDLVDVAERERELQKNESFMDGTYVEQDKAIGASIAIISKFNDKDKNLNIDLVDIETNALIYREYFNLSEFISENNYIQREDYFGRYIEELMEKILEKIRISTAIEIEVAKISENDKRKAKTLLIYCPLQCHLQEGQKLEVYYENILEGSEIVEKVVVGLVEITFVETTKVSTGKVKDGGKEILSIFNNNTKLKCRYEVK